MSEKVMIEPSWKQQLHEYFLRLEWKTFSDFIRNEYQTKTVYPHPKDIFKAFWLTPFDQVRVVILGQDPYHGQGQAHGLSFSVPVGVRLPPSLRNIYKEIEQDVGIHKDMSSGDLSSWAGQGVLLLNSVLSVIAQRPASHSGKGWEDFTDYVIQKISDKHKHVVFMLWGNYAKGKKKFIDTRKHLVLEAAHPSPFSAHYGFFGCRHFSQANAYLLLHQKKEIVW